jgi:Pyruvate/2-oxoacid:ferredoxin oxidoreductase delta subunit
VLDGLCAAGVEFEAVADLCGLAARRDPALKRLASSPDLRIAACFPRAVKWLFHAGRADLQIDRVTVANMRTQSPDQILASLLSGLERNGPREQFSPEDVTAKAGAWIPWFPVVDYSRCQSCKQCLNFCLFGVYALSSDDKVEVRNPDRCKTNCPACARICSEAAIIFPKYTTSPFNGDEVSPENMKKSGVKVDLQSIVGGDVYAKLRNRSKVSRRFAVDPEARSPATEGKLSRLSKLKEQLDIPQEVLDSLKAECKCDTDERQPSPDEQNAPSSQGCSCDCDTGCDPRT